MSEGSPRGCITPGWA